jgi:hypothetical protein
MHNWTGWREHFEGQRNRALPTIVQPYGLPDDWNRALIYSLARFQVGEGGEGRIAREIDQAASPAIDAEYRTALKLFVLEEGRHASILACMIHELGGSLLCETWTNRLFRWGRRRMGIQLKLLVLLVAEVIGIGFYSLLKNRLPAGTFRAALKEIIDDESFHLAFHTEYFRRTLTTPFRKGIFLLLWWSVSLAACTVVYIDHRSTWKAFRVAFFPSALRLLALIYETGHGALGDQPLEPTGVHQWVPMP